MQLGLARGAATGICCKMLGRAVRRPKNGQTKSRAAENRVPNAFGEKLALMFAALTCQCSWSLSPRPHSSPAFTANAFARSRHVNVA